MIGLPRSLTNLLLRGWDFSVKSSVFLSNGAQIIQWHDSFPVQRHRGKAAFCTAEDDLITALVKAGCIPESHTWDKWVDFQRCARTDKGVSSLGQLVSLRLWNSALPEKINHYLPPQMRVLGIRRVTRSFSSKNSCDGRTYSYTLPTASLVPGGSVYHERSFRLPRKTFHNINHLLSFYCGTHNYHNFTLGKTAHDPRGKTIFKSK